MLQLMIADIRINITIENVSDILDDSQVFSRLSPFATSCTDKPDLELHISSSSHINRPSGKLILDEGLKWVVRNNAAHNFSVFSCNENPSESASLLDTNAEWNSSRITYLKNDHVDNYSSILSLTEILFRSKILFHQGIVFHAAAISLQSKGILFCAPSGTGKTTQASLWRKHMGAKIINGDRPAVRIINEQPLAFGTPWSGTSPDFSSTYAPLSAIILLEQSPTNSIRKLERIEIIQFLLPRCFLPYHDNKLMELAINNLEKIIELTPIYLLKCKPDKNSVELVYECIK